MSSSSYRYTEYPTFEYNSSVNQRIHVPIHRASNNSNYEYNNRIQSKDTTIQWTNNPITGGETFRIRINIEGFNQNEVNIRVDGDKLFIYGERIENKSQGTSKKIIEKFYDLPPDIDTFRPHVTFPSPITMQVDFPSKHSSTRHTSPRKSNANNDENRRIPILNSRDSLVVSPHSTYKFHQSMDNPSSTYDEQTAIKTHRQRSSPTTGLQSSYEIEHQRSNSPTLSNIIEEDSLTSSSNDSSIFPRDFNSELFYQSIFQPEIFTDDRNQRYIELKLDVHDYNPDDIKVAINDNDLIVQVENSNFYKQITLPSNIDSTSLSIHHHHDKKLYITIKLLDEYSSFKYI